MGRYFDIDVSEIREFANRLRIAEADFNNQMETFAEAIGYEFLRIVEDEIIRRNVVDTRLLLHSFTKGDSNNIWTLTDEGGKITLEVGTNLEYASYVNDGHCNQIKCRNSRNHPPYDFSLHLYLPSELPHLLHGARPPASDSFILRISRRILLQAPEL